MKYPEYKNLNLPDIAQKITEKWDRENTFKQSIESRPADKPFVFYEGPPSANGMPGIHHVMARAIKDIFCRYKTLKGYRVNRKAGWDTHGLPIELAVEKALGITKEDIGKTISVEKYNESCRQEVMKYTDVWNDLTKKMGYWVDMEHPYVTYENNYIESVWWILKQLYDKNMLYKGYTIQPYSPAAGTGLSSHELNQPGTYKDVKDLTTVAQFRAYPPSPLSQGKREENAPPDGKVLPFGEDLGGAVYFLAWTTTPWTLPSNTALAVGSKITYVLVDTFNHYTGQRIRVILAKNLLGKYFPEKNAELNFDDYKEGDKNIPFKVLVECVGKDLEGIKYEQLLPYSQPEDGDAFRVVTADFVTTDDGTGIVHIAPSFGADDFRTGKLNGIGSLTLVDKRGKFVSEVTDFPNEYVKEAYLSDEQKAAEIERLKNLPEDSELNKLVKQIVNRSGEYLSVDERIAIKLQLEGKLFKKEKYEHIYPHCWRTDKPILYYPLDSWFVRTTAAKDRLIELNKTINWKPESTGTGRFGNWLENLVDWNLSRSRYWGIPLPVWRTEDGSEEICIGSVEDLNRESVKANTVLGISNPVLTDLHRPFIDDVVLVSASGKPMKRELDLIDVWFDSGSMPYAQWHYPFENKDLVDSGRAFPADFIAEGVDQTRGWFFTLHAIATMVFDSVAFKNVVSNGLVLDKNGNKMSKRLGNAVDPFETLAKYGPDATRWYMISNASPWDNLKFDIEGIGEVQRKLFGTLYNTYSFFSIYANIDEFHFDESTSVPVSERPVLDRWIISKMHSLVKDVDSYLADYEPTKATRAVEEFVDRHLSNWYVRLSRRVFWKGEMNRDKQAAYETLFECLTVTAQLMSPVAPFFSDWLYENLKGSGSVHLSDFTVSKAEVIDLDLEERMELAQQITSMILSLRKKQNIRVRQPLQRVMIPVLDKHFQHQLEMVKDLILAEVNIKEMQFLTETEGIIKKKIKPDFKKLGPKFGQKMKAIATAVNGFGQHEIALLEKEGRINLTVDGETLELELTDVEIHSEDIPGWLVASEGRVTVALDITISEDLRNEGIAREVVNRIQNLRKDSGFEVTDRIRVSMLHHPTVSPAIQSNLKYICSEILADSFDVLSSLENLETVSIEIDEQTTTQVSVRKS